MADDPASAEPFVFTARLSVCVDVKLPQAYLALAPVQTLAEELSIDVDWLPFPTPAMKAPPKVPAGEVEDRGSRHRRFRARYLEHDIERYAATQGLTMCGLYRDPDSALASLALLWLRDRAPEHRYTYLQRLFAGYWAERLDVEDMQAIGELLEDLGQNPLAFQKFAAGAGPAELAALRARLVAASVFTVPSLVVDGEVFVGRAHLPMVRWLLSGRTGSPPV